MNPQDHSRNHPAFVPAMGINTQPVHPWVQGQRIQLLEEQYFPSTIPSYISHINLPSGSYAQSRVVNNNCESKVCGQQTNLGFINVSYQLTIPLEFLHEPSILQAIPPVGLKEMVLLGPHPEAIQFFMDSGDAFITVLQHIQSLKKITFSLDFTHLTRIFESLATIPDMREIAFTLPTASKLEPYSMSKIHQAFVDACGSGYFRNLNQLTIPMELVTSLLLSYLAVLPNLESLTVKYSPPPSYHQHPFPVWSSYRAPADCPGHIFLTHLNFDPRGHFKELSHLDLGSPLSDSSYATLKILFPKAHIIY